ncbi:MAG: hypothetical protein HDQ96_11885 [Lachnospiraceae bacterium]|nr:hypothetical protein [Lachnospiraceae bacterium]
MQKINILGMSLTDYSLREAIGITDRFIGSGSLNTILFISAKILVEAGNSEKQRAWIGAADLIVWSDAEIVRQAGISAKERTHEVENQDYLKEVLKRLGRGKKPIYLLAESEEELEQLENNLKYIREDLNIVGKDAVSGVRAEWDDEANRINELAPAAVISGMRFERQAELVESMKKILNADIWLALDHEMQPGNRKMPFIRKILSKWYHYLFQKLLLEYHHKDR